MFSVSVEAEAFQATEDRFTARRDVLECARHSAPLPKHRGLRKACTDAKTLPKPWFGG
jgi:hypothetical protein